MEVRTDSLSGDRHLLVYSLGNYISNMSARHTDGGAVVSLTLEKSIPDGNHHPHTRLVSCSYDLVWTGRPTLTGKKNFILYPVTTPADSLAPAARNRLKIFTENTRKLLSRYNKGIDEQAK